MAEPWSSRASSTIDIATIPGRAHWRVQPMSAMRGFGRAPARRGAHEGERHAAEDPEPRPAGAEAAPPAMSSAPPAAIDVGRSGTLLAPGPGHLRHGRPRLPYTYAVPGRADDDRRAGRRKNQPIPSRTRGPSCRRRPRTRAADPPAGRRLRLERLAAVAVAALRAGPRPGGTPGAPRLRPTVRVAGAPLRLLWRPGAGLGPALGPGLAGSAPALGVGLGAGWGAGLGRRVRRLAPLGLGAPVARVRRAPSGRCRRTPAGAPRPRRRRPPRPPARTARRCTRPARWPAPRERRAVPGARRVEHLGHRGPGQHVTPGPCGLTGRGEEAQDDHGRA